MLQEKIGQRLFNKLCENVKQELLNALASLDLEVTISCLSDRPSLGLSDKQESFRSMVVWVMVCSFDGVLCCVVMLYLFST